MRLWKIERRWFEVEHTDQPFALGREDRQQNIMNATYTARRHFYVDSLSINEEFIHQLRKPFEVYIDCANESVIPNLLRWTV